AELLADQNRAIEIKNYEIEEARRALEERAEQLALSSKYKSEFLANMSHELRTPLNSLLILAKLLSENQERNLSTKQVDFARTIHNAGSDLLQLINDILDLSKVEAGKMDVHPAEIPLAGLVGYVDATFRPLTAEKGLAFSVTAAADVPEVLYSDERRLQQVLRNLLSNAVKFTEEGEIQLLIERATDVDFEGDVLAGAADVIAFSVIDTGIGISEDKLRVIFEAFQQADGTTSRRFGGTGLGLSISREIARLIGGEIHAQSQKGRGSVFTLYLPMRIAPRGPSAGRRTRDGGSPDPAARGSEHAAGSSSGTASDVASPSGSSGRSGGWSGALAGPEDPVDASPRRPAAGPDRDYRAPVAVLPPEAAEVEDDRGSLDPGDRRLLVAADDHELARMAVRVGREQGFKVVVALGADVGFAAARELSPHAVILEIDLVLHDGTTLLDALKRTPQTRHLPTQTVQGSGTQAARQRALQAGALAVLPPPVTAESLAKAVGDLADFLDRPVRRLLVAEGSSEERAVVTELVGGGADVEVVAVSTVEDALTTLRESRFDCVVLDPRLPPEGGFAVLEELLERPDLRALPVIVHAGQDLEAADETELRRYAETMVVKEARSAERLLDESALFLHRVEAQLSDERRRMIEQLRQDEGIFSGRKVLIVDDDVRNVFALASLLERHGIQVLYAEDGREGIEVLRRNDDISLILMDVMMPGMDGNATTEAIRAMPQYADLPVIAVTAKAMKGDRDKSIASGASAYVTKPVDIDRLLALMRELLHR
ncbi:MAG: response regulator, partial [Streptomycetales bacterium]